MEYKNKYSSAEEAILAAFGHEFNKRHIWETLPLSELETNLTSKSSEQLLSFLKAFIFQVAEEVADINTNQVAKAIRKQDFDEMEEAQYRFQKLDNYLTKVGETLKSIKQEGI